MKVKRFLLTQWDDYEPLPVFGGGIATSDNLEHIAELVLYSALLAKKKVGEYCNELDNLTVSDLKDGVEYDLNSIGCIIGSFIDSAELKRYTAQREELFDRLFEKYNEQLDESDLKYSFDYFDNEGMIDFDKDDIKEFIELFFELDDEHNSMQEIIDLD